VSGPKLGALAGNGGPTQTMAPGSGSAAIGAGGGCLDPTRAGSPPLTTDQRGLPRATPCDIGAFQGQEPGSTAGPAITGSAEVGQSIQCSQGTWSGDATLSFAYQWSRDGSPISGASGAAYTVATADIGHQLTCAVTATNPFGQASAGSGAVGVPPAPSISKVHQSHSRWRTTTKAAKLSAKRPKRPPKGTTFSFVLNTPAAVTLTFDRCTVSHKHGHRKRTCKRAAGTLSLGQAHAGAGKVAFAGHLSKHKKLRAGSYAVTLTAANSSGRTTSKALRFTIVG
jgi:hypothetical protein